LIESLEQRLLAEASADSEQALRNGHDSTG